MADKAAIAQRFRLNLAGVRAGHVLPGDIEDINGTKLLRGGTVVDDALQRQLVRLSTRGVYGGQQWPKVFRGEAVEAPGVQATTRSFADTDRMTPIAVDQLRVGASLPRPIYNRKGVMLLASGLEITARFLHRLRQQGTLEVMLPDISPGKPAARPESIEPKRIVRDLDAMLRDTASISIPRRIRKIPRSRLKQRQFEQEVLRGNEYFTESVARTANLMTDLAKGKCRSASPGREMIHGFLKFERLDPSLLPTITRMQEKQNEYLFDHSVNVALLAMTAAAELGLPAEQMIEIGLGSLLSDVGMLKVPDDLRFAPRWLNPEERAEVQKHPFYTLRSLQDVEGLSETSMLIPYQAHERGDGSGYPRNRHLRGTHFISRLVAIADVYGALCSSRPQRNAYGPYEAMAILLEEGRRGRHDRQVLRYFLDAMSVFPIGSYVRLNDGKAARVTRANPGQHTRPVVVPVDETGYADQVEIDLSVVTDLHVIQALRHRRELVLDFTPPIDRNRSSVTADPS